MFGLRYLTIRNIVALLALGVAAYIGGDAYTASLRREFIAELEQRGGKVQVDSGVYGTCGTQPSSAPPTIWETVQDKYGEWRRRGTLISAKLPAPFTRRDAERMQLLAGVKWLEIPEADDEALAALPTFPLLTELVLHSTQRTDVGLSCLTRMPKLSKLELRGQGISDATLLVEHPSLEFIDVAEATLSESGFAALAVCPRGVWLTADHTGLTGRDLLAIPTTKIALVGCDVAGNPIIEQVLVKLYAAPQLISVDASGIEHGPTAVAALAANRELCYLTLNDVRTDWNSLVEALASMTQLKNLSLKNSQLKREHLKRLLRLPELQRLELKGTKITGDEYSEIEYELYEELGDRRRYPVSIDPNDFAEP